MLYNEDFFDSEDVLQGDFGYNLEHVWGEKNTSKKKQQKRQQVESRRRVEEIMAEKKHKELYSDPFEDFDLQ